MRSLSRRNFIKAFAASVATVAIGMRMATAMPHLDDRSVIGYASTLKFKATERFSAEWSDWRCMYGSPGLVDTIPNEKPSSEHLKDPAFWYIKTKPDNGLKQ